VGDALPDHEIIVASGTISELEKLKGSKKKNSKDAAVALQLMQGKKISVVSSKGHVDDWIVRFAEESKDTKVCTNDTELRHRLRPKGIIALTLGKNRNLR
jgi:rRNA-processing protein FCF1